MTNKHYALCVNDGSCKQSAYADEADYNGDNYPIVGVSWFDTEAYCVWADARLPTEAEWEYAARGPEGSTYPWGGGLDGEKANPCDTNCTATLRDERIDDGARLTTPVGNYQAGASWAGALDMSGNVSEWVQDCLRILWTLTLAPPRTRLPLARHEEVRGKQLFALKVAL